MIIERADGVLFIDCELCGNLTPMCEACYAQGDTECGTCHDAYGCDFF